MELQGHWVMQGPGAGWWNCDDGKFGVKEPGRGWVRNTAGAQALILFV